MHCIFYTSYCGPLSFLHTPIILVNVRFLDPHQLWAHKIICSKTRNMESMFFYTNMKQCELENIISILYQEHWYHFIISPLNIDNWLNHKPPRFQPTHKNKMGHGISNHFNFWPKLICVNNIVIWRVEGGVVLKWAISLNHNSWHVKKCWFGLSSEYMLKVLV